MRAAADETGRILDLLGRIEPSDQTAAELATIVSDLNAAAEHWFAGAPGADQVEAGLKFAASAIPASVAAKSLTTAAHWAKRPDAMAGRATAINLRIARSHLIAALQPLGKVGPVETPATPPASPAAPSVPSPKAAAGETVPADAATIDILRNIATYHRAHERFYTQYISEGAVDLYREANRLRIVANVWLGSEIRAPDGGVDFQDPRYQPVGCNDLNALDAIAAIGVLFMEGEAEPSEIRAIKARLQAISGAKFAAGQWLSGKMDAAWMREQAVFAPGLIDGAQARYNTIATNWCGSRATQLSGRVLGIASARLQRMDFRPATIRGRRAEAGRELLQTAWIMVMAAQLDARSAADLGDNDRNWTAYLDVLARSVGSAA